MLRLIATLLLLASAAAARAESTLDRVRRDNIVRCGAETRPGFADAAPGGIGGVAVDLCRAVTIAVLGPTGRVGFQLYDSDRAFDAVRDAQDDLFFLTRDAIGQQKLAAVIQPGPVVFVDAIALMVAEASPIRRPEDLVGRSVCLMIGTRAQVEFDAAAARLGLQVARLAFEEDVEMLDAYNAQRCQAAIGETTYLAEMRGTPGVNRLASRLLAEPLALQPVIAASGIGDAAWSALLFWVLDALIHPDALPVDPPGLLPGWRGSAGSYDEFLQRDLAKELGLGVGLNAVWPRGVLLGP